MVAAYCSCLLWRRIRDVSAPAVLPVDPRRGARVCAVRRSLGVQDHPFHRATSRAPGDGAASARRAVERRCVRRPDAKHCERSSARAGSSAPATLARAAGSMRYATTFQTTTSTTGLDMRMFHQAPPRIARWRRFTILPGHHPPQRRHDRRRLRLGLRCCDHFGASAGEANPNAVSRHDRHAVQEVSVEAS